MALPFILKLQEATTMSVWVILLKNIVADYCNNSNRRQVKTMPETVFLFCSEN